MSKRQFIIIGALLLLPLRLFAYTNLGTPAGFVNDFANILSSEQRSTLETKIKSFEETSKNEIAVVTIKSLDGDTIENFAEKLFSDWGVGKKNADNGVLILIAVQDRQMRIEVGYGLEGNLTDAQSIWIINNIMKPAFQKDDFYSGINGAVDKIISATTGEIIPSEETKKNINMGLIEWLSIFFLFALSWLASILGRSKSWWAGGVVGAVIGIILGFIFGFFFAGFIAILVLSVLGFLFDAVVSKNYSKSKSLGRNPSWWAGGRGFGGGGSGGFGGFGGGGSGGGGASGRW